MKKASRIKKRRKSKSEAPSTSTLVKNFVLRYPSLTESLKHGVINHSALARLIKQEFPQAKMPALIAAVRRLAHKKRGKLQADTNLDSVFKHSRLSAQGGIALLICKNINDFSPIAQLKEMEKEEVFLFMEGIAHFTVVTSQLFLKQVKKALGSSIITTYENLSLLSIALPSSSVQTHGVSARLNGLLAAAGIPILQEMTSAGEYFIVLATEDLSSAIEVLEWRRKMG